DEEKRRGISIYSSVIPVEYRDHKVNFIDTPGYNEFIGEMISGLNISDCALVVVDAVGGFEVGTEIAWQYCDQFKLPRLMLINKMDRENASFQKALDSAANYSSIRLIPVQLPWGEKAAFQGVIDLLTMKAYKGDGKTVTDIPADLKADAEAAHMALVEAAAEGEDALLEKFFDSGELSAEEILRGLKIAVVGRSFVPVFVSAASAEIGIQRLLDGIVDLAPSPKDAEPRNAQGPAGEEVLDRFDAGPLAAYVWKTTADPFVGKQTYFRVYSGVVKADSKFWNPAHNIEERIGSAYIPRGVENIAVKNIHSGDIGTVPKLSETSTGNTLCDRSHPLTLPIPVYPNALFQVAVFPKTQADSTKISSSLTRLCEEDMTLSWFNQAATLQTILQGMGDQ
ncbi:MAG: GTP-binding protein, partial [Anaerolineaceae bacterium]